jgi:hypothetical protein
MTRLADRKAALRRDIALRRDRCAATVTRVTQPLVWLDHVQNFVRSLFPSVRRPGAAAEMRENKSK